MIPHPAHVASVNVGLPRDEEWAGKLRRTAIDKQPVTGPVEVGLLGLAGDAQERLLKREPLINSVVVRYGFCPDFIFSSDRARNELGYSPGPIEPAIADAIAWFRAHGMLP